MKSIELNIEKALGTVSKSDVFALEDKAKSGMEMLHKGTGKGNDFLGWLHLPSEITEAHLADLEAAAKQLKDRCEIVVVIGIGGSYLGAKAVIEALSDSFEFLRSEGYLYVDKTELVYRLVTKGKPYFLSRPRRFGKSLLLSTLEAYFKGKKELFEGLAIEKLEQNWFEYPVLHLSLNAEKYDSRERLERMLELQLERWEEMYGVDKGTMTYSGRFITIIRRAYEQTGRRVVVLVDEYDKPMLQTFDKPDLQEDFRKTLTAFYTVLKDADPYLQFVFITGVTKFAQMGIFSTLNQLNDISFDLEYNTLCGMTRTEIETVFVPELQELALQAETNYDEAIEQLTRQYDGYRFTPEKGFTPMLNPFSVLNALAKSRFGDYWFASGTPTFLVEILKKTNFDLRELDGIEVSSASLSDDRANISNPIPMIYQSGYLTIKEYDPRFKTYQLAFPND